MNTTTLILLSFSMSADAFAVAIAKGAANKQIALTHVIKTAFLFGIVETITPLIGWEAGTIAAPYIEAFDHWISFILLAGLGTKIIYESLNEDDDNNETPNQTGLGLMILTAIATSIDSMIIGVSLAFLNVNILLTALCIGSATTLMSGIGLKLGSILGTKIGSRAEMGGGLVLIGIGTYILLSHLGFF